MAVEEVFAKRKELARLGQQITELAGHLNAGEYRFLVLVEAFDREDGWQKFLRALAELVLRDEHRRGAGEGARRPRAARFAADQRSLFGGPGQLFQGAGDDPGGYIRERGRFVEHRLPRQRPAARVGSHLSNTRASRCQ
jgi:hypothetical protein